ncbi:MAG: LamG-like jellyroll fold domain-containing protein, partial [Marinibacterium sp.]
DPGTDSGKIKAPKKALSSVADFNVAGGMAPVFGIAGSHDFDASERAALAFEQGFKTSMDEGTVALTFSADTLGVQQMLFTKDASGYGKGGHTIIYLNEVGDLKVRMQDDAASYYFDVDFAIEANKTYDVALNFGDRGAELYLNGVLVAYDKDLDVNWAHNKEAFVVGASGWSNTAGEIDNLNNYFTGTISDVMVFDQQLSAAEVFGTAPPPDSVAFAKKADAYSFGRAADGSLEVSKGKATTTIDADTDFMVFSDLTVRPMDVFLGSNGVDYLYGSDSADIMEGKSGNDVLKGYDHDDLLRAGNGDDSLYGGNGYDILMGQIGDDRLYGGNHNDILYGGDGADYLYGESGNDKLYGGLGDDYLYGNTYNDSGTSKKDMAYFDGNFADYSFATNSWYDNSRGANVTQLIVTDHASGGLDGYYEGVDRLLDIDSLVFADQTVDFLDLI